jgi:hypothetical protein
MVYYLLGLIITSIPTAIITVFAWVDGNSKLGARLSLALPAILSLWPLTWLVAALYGIIRLKRLAFPPRDYDAELRVLDEQIQALDASGGQVRELKAPVKKTKKMTLQQRAEDINASLKLIESRMFDYYEHRSAWHSRHHG